MKRSNDEAAVAAASEDCRSNDPVPIKSARALAVLAAIPADGRFSDSAAILRKPRPTRGRPGIDDAALIGEVQDLIANGASRARAVHIVAKRHADGSIKLESLKSRLRRRLSEKRTKIFLSELKRTKA